MIVPFDFRTTSRSGESAEAGGSEAGGAMGAGFSWAQPARPPRMVPADTARTLRSSLWLRSAGALLVPDEGAHVPHPLGPRLPQALPEFPMTFSNLRCPAGGRTSRRGRGGGDDAQLIAPDNRVCQRGQVP